MLATLVIGLREGLEASLIVGIIAAFLRRSGKSLTTMWLGVALAVILSLAVGIGLNLVEDALPQAGQEGMEAVIGVIAVFFVTGMIAWMNAHARDMRRQLEAEAAQALSQASAYALASMAFLAVLREGFETSVFLLATFSAAQSVLLAAGGAAIGLAIAVGLGWGIYVGGVKIDLSRFFRFTGAFLILVAAGLIITSLRSAHEAGWLNAGQQPTVNLSWFVAPGTIQSALITGVLGIPADPRLIEVIGWFAYLVPVALFIYWPSSRRLQGRAAAQLQFSIAGALAAVALGLAVFYPIPNPQPPAQATIVSSAKGSRLPIGSARLSAARDGSPMALKVSFRGDERSIPLPANGGRHEQHDGVETSVWTSTSKVAPADAASRLTLDQVIALAGGRMPIGLNSRAYPGPFTADWSIDRATSVWLADGMLLDAVEHSTTVVTLFGGGLQTSRTITVDDTGGEGLASDWRVSPAYRDDVATKLNEAAAARTERVLWAVQLPIALGIIALVLTMSACRTLMRLRSGIGAVTPIPTGQCTAEATAKGASHATS